MNPLEFILIKQSQWARDQGIPLIGSQQDRGRPVYTPERNDNFFAPLNEITMRDFLAGDGGELSGTPAKIQALHSSAALAVNVFQYWQNDPSRIAHLCGFCRQGTKVSKRISFEQKFSISDKFRFGPNLDVVIFNDPKATYQAFAVECKFSEAYGGWGHGGMKRKYLDLDLWDDLPNLHSLAVEISPDDNQYHFFHAAQMIKHILGLKRVFGRKGFRLLYLWYEVFGEPGFQHAEEIKGFLQIARSDGVKVHALSYQVLIARMTQKLANTDQDYLSYLAARYL